MEKYYKYITKPSDETPFEGDVRVAVETRGNRTVLEIFKGGKWEEVDQGQINNYSKMQSGKVIWDRIIRKINYLIGCDPTDILSNTDRLRKVDSALGDRWDVDYKGDLVGIPRDT